MPDTFCPYLEVIGKASPPPRPYPSHRHRCAAANQVRVIAPRTQASFCLAERHELCPFFSPGTLTQAQPDLLAQMSTTNGSMRGITLAMIVLLLTALMASFSWRNIETRVSAAFVGTAQETVAVTQTPVPSTNTPVPTFTTTATSTPTTTPTSTPTATPTSTPTPQQPPAHQAPSRIQIPHIKLDSPIVQVEQQIAEENGYRIATWKVVDYAVGFHRGSAYPGHKGNTVLSGHHNIKGEVFRYLADVPIGARVMLYAEGRAYPYVVSQKMILPEKYVSLEERQKNARWIGHFPDERLTMVTCWPYEDNTHRLIVIARPLTIPPDRSLPASVE